MILHRNSHNCAIVHRMPAYGFKVWNLEYYVYGRNGAIKLASLKAGLKQHSTAPSWNLLKNASNKTLRYPMLRESPQFWRGDTHRDECMGGINSRMCI